MRIAYLLKKFPRLSETFVLNELLEQERLAGQPLHVFSRRAPDDEPRHPQLARLRAEVELLPSRRGLEPWLALFESGRDDPAVLDSFAGLIRALEGVDHPKLDGLCAEALHLLRRTRELGIDHVHVHFATDSAVVAMMLEALGGPGYSITAHAKDIFRSTVDPTLLALLIERSRFTVTVCDANVDFLRQRLPASAMQRVRRLYNGIDLTAFAHASGPRDERHVLAVGRLVEKKGFDVLVEALALLRELGEEFQATLVGEGDRKEQLEALVAERGLEGRVRLVGAMDQGAVRELMARATVFCLPCVVGDDGNRDALPTVLIEALAMGLPCVSTPVSGVPEILGGGEAGVLVPERDPEATAAALLELFEDRERRERLAREGRARAEQEFDGARIARRLQRWFHESAPAEVAPR